MLFILVLCLTVVFGVRCEDDCEGGRPECFHKHPFSEEALKAYEESGDLLPTNEFFQASCDGLVENLMCIRDYEKACGDPDVKLDFDAIVSNFVEFCDEGSNIRKDYVAHVACLNSINFTAQDCFSLHNSRVEAFTMETHETLYEKGIYMNCLLLYMLKPCAVDTTEELCGNDAGQAVDDVINRAMSVFSCNEDDSDLFEEVLRDLNSKIGITA